MQNNLPSWIKVKEFNRKKYEKIATLLRDKKLTTVCIEANCPNRYECFAKKTATFMILGDTCTRNCRYCNIKKGTPQKVDKLEGKRIADTIKLLNLDYAVITSVTRDDLPDGGAEQFVKVIQEIRKEKPDCKIELLISDLQGKWKNLKKILLEKPDVLNHNIETTKKLFPVMRAKGNYSISLELLKKVKEIDKTIITKSGFMLGLGETKKEITETIKDLKNAGCEIITIGQYLQPNENCVNVQKYYTQEEFDEIAVKNSRDDVKIIAGPLVRSSYKAKESFLKK